MSLDANPCSYSAANHSYTITGSCCQEVNTVFLCLHIAFTRVPPAYRLPVCEAHMLAAYKLLFICLN